jgi:hypothetical protein
MTCGFIVSSIFSSIVVNRRHFLSNVNPDRCNRQGIFSFFRRKVKNERFFLVFFSNSDPKELLSDWDSSSTVGGRSDCVEGLDGMVVSAEEEAKDDKLVLALLGKGGLAVSTVPTEAAAACGGATTATVLLAPASSAMIIVSDTEEVMEGCDKSETLVIDAVVAGFDVDTATADAATAAMLEEASWL